MKFKLCTKMVQEKEKKYWIQGRRILDYIFTIFSSATLGIIYSPNLLKPYTQAKNVNYKIHFIKLEIGTITLFEFFFYPNEIALFRFKMLKIVSRIFIRIFVEQKSRLHYIFMISQTWQKMIPYVSTLVGFFTANFSNLTYT